MSQPESRTNDPAPVISAVPGPSGIENPTGEAPETAKKKDDNSQMEDGENEEPMEHQTLMDSQNGVDETNTTEDVNFKLNCLGKGENGVSVDMETLSKVSFMSLFNPFNLNVLAQLYQKDELISNFRGVGWYILFFPQILIEHCKQTAKIMMRHHTIWCLICV